MGSQLLPTAEKLSLTEKNNGSSVENLYIKTIFLQQSILLSILIRTEFGVGPECCVFLVLDRVS